MNNTDTLKACWKKLTGFLVGIFRCGNSPCSIQIWTGGYIIGGFTCLRLLEEFIQRVVFDMQKTSVPTALSDAIRTLDMVEATGFEHATSASRTQRSTKLSHASTTILIIQDYLKTVKDKNTFFYYFLRNIFSKKASLFRPLGAIKPSQSI